MIEAGRDDQILSIFDCDPVQEIAYIQDHIESAKMIIDWYGELADVSSGYTYIESVS
jgi:hypothetical protein